MLGGTRLLARTVLPKFAGSDVRDPEARRSNPCMKGIPLAALRELLTLQREVDRRLPGIAVPALVVMGGHDHTVELSGARRLARRIGGGPAKLVVLPESYHLVGIDVERDRCADEVLAFFERIPVPRAAVVRPAAKSDGQPKA
jgi:carboxylesterase